MIIEVILFALLSSGSVLCAALWHRKYEESLPLTCCAITALLFFFGIAGGLKLGVYAVCLLCLAAWIFSLVWVVCRKTVSAFLRALLTPGFFIFTALFMLLAALNVYRQVDGWDEFSHWAYCAKSMTYLDDFITNPASGAFFQSYPPGMALMQYFVEKVMLLVRPESEFSEWRLYQYYQVFLLSFAMPFLKNLSFKHPLRLLAGATIVLLLPLSIYPQAYQRLTIEPFLGFVAGAGFAMLLTRPNEDTMSNLYILSCCFLLVLIKSVGTLFALFLALALLLSRIAALRQLRQPVGTKTTYWLSAGCAASVALPLLLWKLNMSTHHASQPFSNPIDWLELLRILLGRDHSYRASVFGNYWQTFWTSGFAIGDTGILLPYPAIFLLLMVGLYLLNHHRNALEPDQRHARSVTCYLLCSLSLMYIVGLCVTYLFKFSQYEAEQLADFARYLDCALMILAVALALSSLAALDTLAADKQNVAAALLCVAAIAVVPWNTAMPFFTRQAVTTSVTMRQPYNEMTERVRNAVGDHHARIYFISQETTGLDSYVMHYALFPCDSPSFNPYLDVSDGVFEGEFLWSIGEPFYEGDVWTLHIDAEEWISHLQADFDYVVLYKLNDYFYEHFASAFAVPDDIAERCVYRVDSETGLLEICE
ncbi:MAG: hypothetical protein RSE58_12125 [Clostridia bacterium]